MFNERGIFIELFSEAEIVKRKSITSKHHQIHSSLRTNNLKVFCRIHNEVQRFNITQLRLIKINILYE